MKKYIFILFAGLMVLSLLAFATCAKKDIYGTRIKSDIKYEQVATILGNPDQFVGKEVGLRGKIALECGSGCWFQLDDGTGQIMVDLAPANFAVPQMTGKSVVIMGTVVRDEERIVLNATGVKF